MSSFGKFRTCFGEFRTNFIVVAMHSSELHNHSLIWSPTVAWRPTPQWLLRLLGKIRGSIFDELFFVLSVGMTEKRVTETWSHAWSMVPSVLEYTFCGEFVCYEWVVWPRGALACALGTSFFTRAKRWR